MDIPHAGRRLGRDEVPLNGNGAGLRPLGGYDGIGPPDATFFATLADLYHRLRAVRVGEEKSAGHDDRVGFADDFGFLGKV